MKTCSMMLFFVIIISLTGCGYPIIQKEVINPNTQDTATLILGANIGDGNITGMLLALYMNGEKMPFKGICVEGAYSGTVPSLIPVLVWKNSDYVAANKNKTVYRAWEIPSSMIKSGGDGLLYITAVRAGKTAWAREIMSGLMSYPAPFTYEPFVSSWTYTGNRFKITHPGVYYLGEIIVKGNMERQGSGVLLDSKMKYESDLEKFNNYLSTQNLSGIKYTDLSKTGSDDMKGSRFVKDLKGK